MTSHRYAHPDPGAPVRMALCRAKVAKERSLRRVFFFFEFAARNASVEGKNVQRGEGTCDPEQITLSLVLECSWVYLTLRFTDSFTT